MYITYKSLIYLHPPMISIKILYFPLIEKYSCTSQFIIYLYNNLCQCSILKVYFSNTINNLKLVFICIF